jgi:acyl-CoA thioesterase FadM
LHRFLFVFSIFKTLKLSCLYKSESDTEQKIQMTSFSKELSFRWSDLDPNFHVRHSAYYDFGAQHHRNSRESWFNDERNANAKALVPFCLGKNVCLEKK